MASLLDVAVRRAGEGGFDKPVAALAGGAAAALLMLMPVDVLQNLVIDSGLPSLLAAAEPPLGMKARVLIGVVAAVVTFGAVYGVMRMLGRKPSRPTRWGAEESDTEFEPAPRMRRRDLHPDAPIPAPISALRDLGDPEGERVKRTPFRLGELLAEPEPEPTPEREPEPELEPESSFEPETAFEPEPQAEPEELILSESNAIEEPAPARPEPAEAPVQAQGEETIAELLARLERALEKKAVPQWLERPEAPAPPPQPGPIPANEEAAEPMDARLRSALENLKRFAPAHG